MEAGKQENAICELQFIEICQNIRLGIGEVQNLVSSSLTADRSPRLDLEEKASVGIGNATI